MRVRVCVRACRYTFMWEANSLRVGISGMRYVRACSSKRQYGEAYSIDTHLLAHCVHTTCIHVGVYIVQFLCVCVSVCSWSHEDCSDCRKFADS